MLIHADSWSFYFKIDLLRKGLIDVYLDLAFYVSFPTWFHPPRWYMVIKGLITMDQQCLQASKCIILEIMVLADKLWLTQEVWRG